MDNQARPGRNTAKRLTPSGESLRLSSVGLQFGFSILVGAAIGYGLDRLLGTTPWLMIILLGLGFAAGVLSVVRASRTGRNG
jgi:ATP synthase protein I